jgi:membrane protease YdiL (CAAX protease family)
LARLRQFFEGLHLDVAVVLLWTTLSLLALEYFSIRPVFIERDHWPIPLAGLARWSVTCFFLWVVGPALLSWILFRVRLRDIGLSLQGVHRHLPLYLLLYLGVLPLVFLASKNPEFLRTYPFADSARDGLRALVRWELIYGLQFFSLEFFFRGFVIFILAKRWGLNAVFVMVVPYCMLHFHKPLPEATGAIGAGLLLGILALKTRSIFGGVLIHWAVAITMDVLAILQSGGFRGR